MSIDTTTDMVERMTSTICLHLLTQFSASAVRDTTSGWLDDPNRPSVCFISVRWLKVPRAATRLVLDRESINSCRIRFSCCPRQAIPHRKGGLPFGFSGMDMSVAGTNQTSHRRSERMLRCMNAFHVNFGRISSIGSSCSWRHGFRRNFRQMRPTSMAGRLS